jgi:hypothetical protein
MNSRRRLGLPLLLRFRRAETITFRRVTPLVHHSKFGGQCLRWVSSARRDPAVASTHVRFAPKADKKQIISVCPLRAISGCEQSQQGSAPPVLLGTGWPGKNATLGPRPLINLQSAGGKREKSIVLSFRAPVRL